MVIEREGGWCGKLAGMLIRRVVVPPVRVRMGASKIELSDLTEWHAVIMERHSSTWMFLLQSGGVGWGGGNVLSLGLLIRFQCLCYIFERKSGEITYA